MLTIPKPHPQVSASPDRIWDLVLAGAFEPGEGAEPKYPFYQEIKSVCERAGKRLFLPHEDIDWQTLKPAELVRRVRGIIRSTDLVVGYSGIPSAAAGIMLEMARHDSVPAILVYDVGKAHHREMRALPEIIAEIEFSTETEALTRLETALNTFYQGRAQ